MTFAPFSFASVADIHLEWGGARRLGALLAPRFTARRACLVTDGGLVAAGMIGPVRESLAEAGFVTAVFDGVVADPPEQVVEDCLALARAERAEIVIGLGGGSSLDVAKLVAVLAQSPQSLAQIYGIGHVQGGRLPLVLVPTTAGTGSEVTNISIITTGITPGESTKTGVVSAQLYADFVLLDAQLTLSVPPLHTAATGIDAMVHAIEAYSSRLRKNPMSDALAREALRLLSGNLIAACTDGRDPEARENMLLGATLAGQAFSNAPVAAVHALAYPLGEHYHLPHGLTNALMLGPVLRHNARVAAPLYAELAEVVCAPGHGDAQTRAAQFVSFMQGLTERSGAPRRLRDVGVTESSLPMLARAAMKHGRLLVNNPVEVTEADALAFYRAAY